ncbi:MAG: mersacidin/lichenicidin family type 2 lantibiotic [Cyanosarcina radialis HA8281-LM2]|jgi:mersacidin/lichenicidin family type 2 lantibiotic|nr:mersacidin/lichenicidin family type 2 lantibiotic [Cyanosarcina radialis HA8281-LM2]
MSQENIIRAWKDADFRYSLSETERALLPENPAGSIELTDTELAKVAGGIIPISYEPICSFETC